MAHATPRFVPRPADDLTMRTLPVFFGVLELLMTGPVPVPSGRTPLPGQPERAT